MSELIEHLVSALAGRYPIERELGRGGMATVYLAHDVKHQRQVALKVLKPELAATLGAERFLQEIRVTANLQHPHILPLYDSGEVEGFLFYTMPFVAGESLRQRLEREGQLPIDDALRISEDAAAALDYAHRQGVIHRDIKPENILLHEGEAMVADFGIALAVQQAGGERLTETGLSLGTPAYMSPEQAAGDRAVDARSDVYALACVLYEMLVGQPPFTGPTARAVLARHVTDPVPPVRTVRPGVSSPIAAAITKALAKVPVDRFPSATAFAEALRVEVAETEAKSIVVLPFENLSPDPDNAFFADGLTEELITELSRLRGLRVISRTTAMRFKDTAKSIGAITRELNVRYALEGSVRRAAAAVRITAQLIDGPTDSHVWAERYGGQVNDIFDFQEQLARRIVEALRVALTPDESRRLASRPINDPRAYDAWLRAHHEIWKFTPDGFERGIRLLRQAQEFAGENALLHAALGYVHALSYDFGIAHDDETLRRAEEHASRALELDPTVGLGLYAAGWVRYKQGDLPAFVRYLRKATARETNTEALAFLGFILAVAGKLDEARGVADEALALDPLHMFTNFSRGAVSFLDGRFDVASARFQTTLDDLAPDEPVVLWFQGQAMAHAGRHREAREQFARVAATNAVPFSDLSALYCLCVEGNRAAVARFLESKQEMIEAAKTDEWYPNFIATCLTLVNDEVGACDWLERSIDWGFCNVRYMEEYNPFFRSLDGNPRFQQLVAKTRLKHEAFDA